jgi:hypothetical protein
MTLEQNCQSDLFQTLGTARCSNLTFNFDSDDFFNSIQPQEIADILTSYHRTYWRFLKDVFNQGGENKYRKTLEICEVTHQSVHHSLWCYISPYIYNGFPLYVAKPCTVW